MAQSYELANGFILTEDENNLLVTNAENDSFTISTKGIFRQTNGENKALNGSEAKKICQDLLCALFDLPQDVCIKKTDLKQQKERMQFVLNAENSENKIQIEIKSQNKTAEFNRESTTTQEIKGGETSKRSQIRYYTNDLERSYTKNERQKDVICGDAYRNAHKTLFLRSVNKRGDQLILERKNSNFYDDGYTPINDEKMALEISANGISMTIDVATDRYKKRLSADYQTKDNSLKIRLKRTDYDAIIVTEEKATILTHKTGKKVSKHTLYDKEFDATFIRHGDASFEYKQAQTNAKVETEKYETTSELNCVNAEILNEEKRLQDILKRLTILANSQQNSNSAVNFAQNPSIFDDVINFNEIKDMAAIEVTNALAHQNPTLQGRLLSEIARISSNDNILSMMQNKQYS